MSEILTVGIIPDGSRTWAKKEGMSFEQSYVLGAEVGARIVEESIGLGVERLVFFALAQNNVEHRPPEQIEAVLRGVEEFITVLPSRTPNVLLNCHGDLSDPRFNELAKLASSQSSSKPKIITDLLINYSAEWDLQMRPIRTASIPDLNVVIRTCEAPHLSGFLPVQSAYAQLYFKGLYWQEFTPEQYREIITNYRDNFAQTISGA